MFAFSKASVDVTTFEVEVEVEVEVEFEASLLLERNNSIFINYLAGAGVLPSASLSCSFGLTHFKALTFARSRCQKSSYNEAATSLAQHHNQAAGWSVGWIQRNYMTTMTTATPASGPKRMKMDR